MQCACIALVGFTACTPNPRNEMAPIAAAALSHAVQETRDRHLCVHRAVTPWQPAAEAKRVDTPAPTGFGNLRNAGVFRGGGALKGDRVGGVPVRELSACVDLRGPLVAGDRAMVESTSRRRPGTCGCARRTATGAW